MKITIFVDVQNDFVDGCLGVDKDHEVADRILEYAKTCHERGTMTIATRDTHYIETYANTLEGKRLPVLHCKSGEHGHKLYGEMGKYMDIELYKSTFMCESLCAVLRKILGLVSTYDDLEIEVCGFCTSICVISNALYLRGLFPDSKISIIENLCGDVDDKCHNAALAVAHNCQIDTKTV